MSWDDNKNLGPAARARLAKHEKAMAGTVKVVDKDSAEFEQLCAECTPPSEIVVRHGMNKVFIAEKPDQRCKVDRRPRKVDI